MVQSWCQSSGVSGMGMTLSKSMVPLSIRPFLFSLLVISSLSSKVIHLQSHRTSISLLDWVILFPALILPDLVLASLGRLLLSRTSPRWTTLDAGVVGTTLALITAVAAAIENGFYWHTNSEVDWIQARKFLFNTQGAQVLFSGSNSVLVFLFLNVVLAKISALFLYKTVGNALQTIFGEVGFQTAMVFRHRSSAYESEERGRRSNTETIRKQVPIRSWRRLESLTSCYGVSYLMLHFVAFGFYAARTDVPYRHLIGSLPFTLFGNSQSNDSEFCVPSFDLHQKAFPLAYTLDQDDEDEENLPKTWWSRDLRPKKNHDMQPKIDWLPEEEVPGFTRWYGRNSSSEHPYYDSQADPLRISNGGLEVLEELRDAFDRNSVSIKNVMMITLESTRKDVFPLKESSLLYETIVESHAGSIDEDLYQLFADMSPTAEILTGEHSGFDLINSQRDDVQGTWRSLPEAMGGLNIVGAISSSTYTLKNLLASHCGVGGLPVHFADEVDYDPYQPCLPQILNLFNAGKTEMQDQDQDDFRFQEWDTCYIQSVTDQFDNQEKLVQGMGFSNSIARAQIQAPTSKFYPPTEPQSYYFGYPDSQVKPYIRDTIQNAKDQSRRFFISHLTATTHHPWVLPPAFGDPKQYMGQHGEYEGDDLNDYLNTIKYGDTWMGEIMDILEETGVANETLTVIVGDHGFAFREDDATYSTYNGAHVSNFRIPLLFHHPHLPRIQLSVNASTMSILPTIIDLLSSSNSLNAQDNVVAEHLLDEYEGQSLIRPFQTMSGERQAWHISLMSPGGSFLAVSSAAFPYRLIMPLCQVALLRFTNLDGDEAELTQVHEWSIEKLSLLVEQEFGIEAATWVREAKEVGTWWFWETRRLWNYRETQMLELSNVVEVPELPDDEPG